MKPTPTISATSVRLLSEKPSAYIAAAVATSATLSTAATIAASPSGVAWRKAPGDPVTGGTLNGTGGLVIVARRVGAEQQRLEERLSESVDQIGDLRDQLEKIRAGSMTDPITSLPNRRSFERSLEKAMAEWEEQDTSGCLMLCDIDDFKKFNDAWGHLTGDQVLGLVAAELRHKIVNTGMVARLGGAQFAITLPGTQLEVARAVADQIRCAVMSRDITMRSTNQRLGRVSLSFGVAASHVNETPDMLQDRASLCLRAAKDRGRNRVVCEGDPAPARELQVAFG